MGRSRITRFVRFGIGAGVLALWAAGAATEPASATRQTTGSPPLGLDLYVPEPEDNRASAEKVALGRLLFHDPRLSRDETVACVNCHAPELGFTDGLPVAVGVGGSRGTRNAPTLINRAWGNQQFWDGRALSIEEQALATIASNNEMDLPLDELVRRVAGDRDYRERFAALFDREVTAADIARAIAAYVRTIQAGDSPFDRHQFGDQEALSREARRGMELFSGAAECWRCHAGPTFSDEQFHNTGVAWGESAITAPQRAAHPTRVAGEREARKSLAPSFRDVGRFAVTEDERDLGAFKTPTLREVARTAPYMHDGSIATLEEVVEFYDRGGNPNPYLDRQIRPLSLTQADKDALVSFLRSLSGRVQEGIEGAEVGSPAEVPHGPGQR